MPFKGKRHKSHHQNGVENINLFLERKKKVENMNIKLLFVHIQNIQRIQSNTTWGFQLINIQFIIPLLAKNFREMVDL